MARERRIEFANALYHVMARGNRREAIVLDDEDRKRFETTLEQLVGSTGFEILAYVLMGNHYHLLLRTPAANLVEGMRWFQNTWTRRFNARHRAWGRLFGDRYKAKPVEPGAYPVQLIHYIHLNPVRAGLVKRGDRMESYPWSSLVDFLAPKRKRRSWMSIKAAFEIMGVPDSPVGRRRVLQRTEALVDWNRPHSAGDGEEEEPALQSSLQRGWYFGTEAFREHLLEMLGEPFNASAESAKGYAGSQNRERSLAAAERFITQLEGVLEMGPEDWPKLRKNDWRKGLTAELVRQRRIVPCHWLAQRLHTGAPNALSRVIRQGKESRGRSRELEKRAQAVIAKSKSFD